MTKTNLHKLHDDFGQSPWVDNLSRAWLRSNRISELVELGVRGLTSNPAIFAKAIGESNDYDEQFSQLLATGLTVRDAYWEMVCDDVTNACDLLNDVWKSSVGTDGFASIEVSPEDAHDADATIAMARQLWTRIDRKNVMIKVPATDAGLIAIEALIAEGINVNVTLIFTVARYQQVWHAFVKGAEKFASSGRAVSQPWPQSVASFFISRTDNAIEPLLVQHNVAQHSAKVSIAQAKLAYAWFIQQLPTAAWMKLANGGAQPQRLLWASVTPKSASVPDTLYVDELIGSNTVSTIPEVTLMAFLDHGKAELTLPRNLPGAVVVLRECTAAGIDLGKLGSELEVKGAELFTDSFVGLLQALEKKAANV